MVKQMMNVVSPPIVLSGASCRPVEKLASANDTGCGGFAGGDSGGGGGGPRSRARHFERLFVRRMQCIFFQLGYLGHEMCKTAATQNKLLRA